MRNNSIADLDLVGGDPALDLANTKSPRSGERSRDLIANYDDLIAWGRRVGVLGEHEAALARAAAAVPARAAAALRAAKELREAIYQCFSALAAGRQAPEAAFARLCRHARAALRRRELRLERIAADWNREAIQSRVNPLGKTKQSVFSQTENALGAGGATWEWEEGWSLQRVLWPPALAAAELMADPRRLARLKECRGANCGWLFLDTSRNGSRLWCSSADCGNLDKVRRFRAARRATAGR